MLRKKVVGTKMSYILNLFGNWGHFKEIIHFKILVIPKTLNLQPSMDIAKLHFLHQYRHLIRAELFLHPLWCIEGERDCFNGWFYGFRRDIFTSENMYIFCSVIRVLYCRISKVRQSGSRKVVGTLHRN